MKFKTVTIGSLCACLAMGSMAFAAPMQHQRRERHPQIRKAMRQISNAKNGLVTDASRDFGGHRAKAVELINEAIEQLKQALAADKG